MIFLFGCLQASFVASGNRTDISLDDPNFWDKWAKKAEIDMETVNGRVSSLFFFFISPQSFHKLCLYQIWFERRLYFF